VEDYYELVKGYYERRATEYDACLGEDLYSHRGQTSEELGALHRAIPDRTPCSLLDVSCVSGFLTVLHPRGEVVGLDQSEAMFDFVHEGVSESTFLRGEALDLPFSDATFVREFCVIVSNLFHMPKRSTLLRETRR
jgi:ubiquinone/menaquinone biosynthesis C-methylase UbiE